MTLGKLCETLVLINDAYAYNHPVRFDHRSDWLWVTGQPAVFIHLGLLQRVAQRPRGGNITSTQKTDRSKVLLSV